MTPHHNTDLASEKGRGQGLPSNPKLIWKLPHSAETAQSTPGTRFGMFKFRKARYARLTGTNSESNFSSSDEEKVETMLPLMRESRRSWPLMGCFVILNILLLLISSTMFIMSLRPPSLRYTNKITAQSRNHLLKQMSIPSPMLDETDIRISPKRMDATLLQRNPPVIYREPPSDAVDIAWQALVDTRPVPLSRSQVEAIGKSPSRSVQIPPSWGHGNESYFGRIDVFHQIHCLDALRREAHFEYYYGESYPHGWNDTTEFHRLHLSHCVYLLLQNIMCNANTDVYTHIWTDALVHPFPDFNINHQCKDFSAVMEWQEKNGLDEESFVALKKPEGYAYRKMSRKFKEVNEWEFESEEEKEELEELLENADPDGENA